MGARGPRRSRRRWGAASRWRHRRSDGDRAQPDDPGTTPDASLASDPMIFLAKDAEQICLVVVGRLEQLHPLQHFDLTGSTARAAARKGDGCPYFVADVEQVTALRSIDDLGPARAASFELYLRHATRCSERPPTEQPGFGRGFLGVCPATISYDRRHLAASLPKPRGGLLENDLDASTAPTSVNYPRCEEAPPAQLSYAHVRT